MTAPLRGVALIPDSATIARIRAVAARLPRGAVDPARHLPHLTVWQSPSPVPFDAGAVPVPQTGRITGVKYHPGGWYFAHVAVSPAVYAAHDALLRRGRFPRRADLPPTDALAYATTGYRYAGAAYQPHITVARADFDPTVLAAWDVALRGRFVTFHRSVAVRFGEHGTIEGTDHAV